MPNNIPSLAVNNLQVHIYTTHKHITLQRQLVDVCGWQGLTNGNESCLPRSRTKFASVLLQTAHAVNYLAKKQESRFIMINQLSLPRVINFNFHFQSLTRDISYSTENLAIDSLLR